MTPKKSAKRAAAARQKALVINRKGRKQRANESVQLGQQISDPWVTRRPFRLIGRCEPERSPVHAGVIVLPGFVRSQQKADQHFYLPEPSQILGVARLPDLTLRNSLSCKLNDSHSQLLDKHFRGSTFGLSPVKIMADD